MTVGELIKELQAVDQERIVIISRDGEGNSFSPLSELSTQSYTAESTYFGEIGLEELTPELIEQGYSEEDVIEGEKALVFWPMD